MKKSKMPSSGVIMKQSPSVIKFIAVWVLLTILYSFCCVGDCFFAYRLRTAFCFFKTQERNEINFLMRT